jgi:hypothetical protein
VFINQEGGCHMAKTMQSTPVVMNGSKRIPKCIDRSALRDKLSYNRDEAAFVLGISLFLLDKLLLETDPITQKPRLHSGKIGRRRIIPRKSLEAYLEVL